MDQKTYKAIIEASALLDSADSFSMTRRAVEYGEGENVYVAWEWNDGNRMEKVFHHYK